MGGSHNAEATCILTEHYRPLTADNSARGQVGLTGTGTGPVSCSSYVQLAAYAGASHQSALVSCTSSCLTAAAAQARMPAGNSGQVETLKFVQTSSGLQSFEPSWANGLPQQSSLSCASGVGPAGCSTVDVHIGQGALSAALRASKAAAQRTAGELC